MNETQCPTPAGTHATDGILQRSPYSVADTVQRLTEAIHAAGATLFTLVDHSGEAEKAGLFLRDTKLLVFGSPAGGTPAMVASPLTAIDLPLKVLVWQDDAGTIWMSYLDPAWLATRHGLTEDVVAPLHAAGKLVARVTGEPVTSCGAENQVPYPGGPPHNRGYGDVPVAADRATTAHPVAGAALADPCRPGRTGRPGRGGCAPAGRAAVHRRVDRCLTRGARA
ncbi:MAG TPA: DUF302 domain-containing protein [Streptosporangiaceae bacterium]|nr:DUF302 domain-containing protein [Streptosporangiaceae bacterium]